MKTVLLNLLQKCFNDDEMSILSALKGNHWDPPESLVPGLEKDVDGQTAGADTGGWYPTILDILKHVVLCDEMYLGQAYQYKNSIAEEDYESLQQRLEQAHSFMLQKANAMSEEELQSPVNTACHGESAENLFAVLARHHVNHGAQIKVLRRYLGRKK